MDQLKIWIHALRLRTLPLSISGILVGLGLSPFAGRENLWVLFGCLVTTLLFQILSNLANDLGDAQKGTDNANRIGPMRAVQSGKISQKTMKIAVVLSALLSLLSAGVLIYHASLAIGIQGRYLYAFLAVLSIAAAVMYTVGKNAYGYLGLGDMVVFLFFGMLAVIGTKHLYTSAFNICELLGAISIGGWSVGVLNLNNMRDQENDRESGKKTLVVKMGFLRAKQYHFGLIALSSLSWFFLIALVFFENRSFWMLLGLLPFPFFLKHLKQVKSIQFPMDFDPELKKVALSCFLAAFSFYIATLLSS